MNENEILEKLRRTIIDGIPEVSIDLVNEALEAMIDPKRILNDAIIRGMNCRTIFFISIK